MVSFTSFISVFIQYNQPLTFEFCFFKQYCYNVFLLRSTFKCLVTVGHGFSILKDNVVQIICSITSRHVGRRTLVNVPLTDSIRYKVAVIDGTLAPQRDICYIS